MSQIKPHYASRMTLDEAISKTRTAKEDAAYMEIMNIWTNQRE